ncbi:MAG: hypothetical protein QXD20_09855 [Ignisphaera sp.]
MAVIVYSGDKSIRITSPISGQSYRIEPNSEVNMLDIDAIYYFGYGLRESLTDDDIQYIFLARLDWAIDLQTWKERIEFAKEGEIKTKRVLK